MILFLFQCSCKLNHTNIPCRKHVAAMCIHIKEIHNTRPLCRPISFDFLHVSLFWIYVSNIICKQPSFIIATPTGIRGIKWTFIWHFRISMSRNTDFVRLLWYQQITVSLLYRKIKLPNLLVFVGWYLCGTRASASTMADDGSRYQSSSHRQKS